MKTKAHFLLKLTVLMVFFAGCLPANPQSQPTPIRESATTPALSSGDKIGSCQQIIITYKTFGRQGWESNIVSSCPDGSERRRLTSGPSSDVQPTWSPDGKWIAFLSDLSGTYQLYLMDENGGNIHQITFDLYTIRDWIWLPDGKRIAVRTDAGDGVWRWHAVDINTGDINSLAGWPNDLAFRPESFSHDGTWLAYTIQQNDSDSMNQIRIQKMDGSQDQLVTAGGDHYREVAWSPDDQRIGFLELENKDSLYLIDPDGRNLELVAGALSEVTSPFMAFDWSPDGERLAIADGSSLYVLHLISGEKRTLFTIEEPNEINHVSWQP